MKRWLDRLSPRDRAILGWALPLIALLAVLVLGRQLLAERHQAVADLDMALEDMAWLQAQRDSLATPRHCQPQPWSASLPGQLANRHGVEVAVGDAGGSLELRVAPSSGNAVLSWLRELECQGAVVETLDLETGDGPGVVSGQVVVRPPVT